VRAGAALAVVVALGTSSVPFQPLGFLSSDVNLDAHDWRQLHTGQVLVKVLPAVDRDLAVVAMARTTAPPDRLIAWMRDVASLQRSRYVPVVVRFSDPPGLDDLALLTLTDEELGDLRECRPGDCGVKLSAAEIMRFRQRTTAANWRDALQDEFRRAVLERVERYLAEGDYGLPPYDDDRAAVFPDAEVAGLVDRLGLRSPQLPGVARYLQWFPRESHPEVVDSFLYWSQETLGVKPIATVTHMTLLRSDVSGQPAALAIAKQVYATHYKNGSVSLTAIVGSGSTQRLVYVRRSTLDVFRGIFGGLVRRTVEHHVRDEVPTVLNAIRARLEAGDPPDER